MCLKQPYLTKLTVEIGVELETRTKSLIVEKQEQEVFQYLKSIGKQIENFSVYVEQDPYKEDRLEKKLKLQEKLATGFNMSLKSDESKDKSQKKKEDDGLIKPIDFKHIFYNSNLKQFDLYQIQMIQEQEQKFMRKVDTPTFTQTPLNIIVNDRGDEITYSNKCHTNISLGNFEESAPGYSLSTCLMSPSLRNRKKYIFEVDLLGIGCENIYLGAFSKDFLIENDNDPYLGLNHANVQNISRGLYLWNFNLNAGLKKDTVKHGKNHTVQKYLKTYIQKTKQQNKMIIEENHNYKQSKMQQEKDKKQGQNKNKSKIGCFAAKSNIDDDYKKYTLHQDIKIQNNLVSVMHGSELKIKIALWNDRVMKNKSYSFTFKLLPKNLTGTNGVGSMNLSSQYIRSDQQSSQKQISGSNIQQSSNSLKSKQPIQKPSQKQHIVQDQIINMLGLGFTEHTTVQDQDQYYDHNNAHQFFMISNYDKYSIIKSQQSKSKGHTTAPFSSDLESQSKFQMNEGDQIKCYVFQDGKKLRFAYYKMYEDSNNHSIIGDIKPFTSREYDINELNFPLYPCVAISSTKHKVRYNDDFKEIGLFSKSLMHPDFEIKKNCLNSLVCIDEKVQLKNEEPWKVAMLNERIQKGRVYRFSVTVRDLGFYKKEIYDDDGDILHINQHHQQHIPLDNTARKHYNQQPSEKQIEGVAIGVCYGDHMKKHKNFEISGNESKGNQCFMIGNNTILSHTPINNSIDKESMISSNQNINVQFGIYKNQTIICEIDYRKESKQLIRFFNREDDKSLSLNVNFHNKNIMPCIATKNHNIIFQYNQDFEEVFVASNDKVIWEIYENDQAANSQNPQTLMKFTNTRSNQIQKLIIPENIENLYIGALLGHKHDQIRVTQLDSLKTVIPGIIKRNPQLEYFKFMKGDIFITRVDEYEKQLCELHDQEFKDKDKQEEKERKLNTVQRELNLAQRELREKLDHYQELKNSHQALNDLKQLKKQLKQQYQVEKNLNLQIMENQRKDQDKKQQLNLKNKKIRQQDREIQNLKTQISKNNNDQELIKQQKENQEAQLQNLQSQFQVSKSKQRNKLMQQFLEKHKKNKIKIWDITVSRLTIDDELILNKETLNTPSFAFKDQDLDYSVSNVQISLFVMYSGLKKNLEEQTKNRNCGYISQELDITIGESTQVDIDGSHEQWLVFQLIYTKHYFEEGKEDELVCRKVNIDGEQAFKKDSFNYYQFQDEQNEQTNDKLQVVIESESK